MMATVRRKGFPSDTRLTFHTPFYISFPRSLSRPILPRFFLLLSFPFFFPQVSANLIIFHPCAPRIVPSVVAFPKAASHLWSLKNVLNSQNIIGNAGLSRIEAVLFLCISLKISSVIKLNFPNFPNSHLEKHKV